MTRPSDTDVRRPFDRSAYWYLRNAVAQALAETALKRPASPVNFTLANHVAITRVLHEHVFLERYRSLDIPIVFADGSKPPLFPVGCFAPMDAPRPAGNEDLRLGLMSFRHPELDYLVDLYVTRNRELAEGVATAEAERVSYERTVRLLSEPALRSGGDLAVLQTGFQPMVIGFYRGVVRVLRARQEAGLSRTLIIRSYVYSPPTGTPRETEQPTRYQPDSPGACFENYRLLCTWC